MSLPNMLDLRANFAIWDENRTIELALKRPVRAGATRTYKPLDQVQVWEANLKIWQNGFRLVAETGSSLVVERGRRIINVPTLWIRPMGALLDQDIIANQPSGAEYYEPAMKNHDPSHSALDSLWKRLQVVIPIRVHRCLNWIPTVYRRPVVIRISIRLFRAWILTA